MSKVRLADVWLVKEMSVKGFVGIHDDPVVVQRCVGEVSFVDLVNLVLNFVEQFQLVQEFFVVGVTHANETQLVVFNFIKMHFEHAFQVLVLLSQIVLLGEPNMGQGVENSTQHPANMLFYAFQSYSL